MSETDPQRPLDPSLSDAKSLFISLVHSIPACFIRKDREGRIVFANEKAAVLLGVRPEDMVGKTVADFYHAELAEGARMEDRQVIETGLVVEDIFDALVDGQKRYFASRKGPVRNEQGQITGIQSIFWDITEQRLAEEALNREREELRAAKIAADEANRAKSDFLANMSHEIRTPMNAIIGITDLLLQTDLTSTQEEYLRMVQDSGEALLNLINDVLDFSKIESGKFQLDQQPFDLREVLGDALKGLGFRAHGKGLELACHIDPNIPALLIGDGYRLRQVVVNLIGNAIKFTDSGEIVLEIHCRQRTDTDVQLHFAVSDTGIGISPENCEKIFREFEQADASTTRRFGGTGLGLAICARLVELMQGRIWVESILDAGSKFQFEINLLIDPDHDVSVEASPVNLNETKVLVVDDNATNRRILKDMLTNWGMQPVTTSGGASALQALRDAAEENDAFRLIISDFNMPEMDGRMLVEAVLERSLLGSDAIIMLTSGIRSDDTRMLEELGVKVLLLKPAKQSEIYNAVVHSLSRGDSNPRKLKNETQLPASNRADGAATKTSSPAASLPSLHVLLAEDNTVNQKLAIAILERAGHRVTVAENGVKALSAIDKESFDLVLMDVQMPEMDGLTATRKLRQQEESTGQHLPVIAMTAHAMQGDRENCLAAGMDEYLSKPIRAATLERVLMEVFQESQMPSAIPNSTETTPSLRDDVSLPSETQINWKRALRNTAGDQELLLELLETFLDEVPRLVDRLNGAIEQQDRKQIGSLTHSVKGSLGFLETADAQAWFQNLEDCAEIVAPHELSEKYTQCQIRLEQVIEEIKQYLLQHK